MTAPKMWTIVSSSPRTIVRSAKNADEAGFDGMVVTDSQNLAGDCYVALTAAALSTTSLQLATGVTNPVTRHPAVTAAAIAAIQHLSGGRASLAIGRGDSALAHLGRAPASLVALERYARALQHYLRGEEIPFSELDFHERLAPPVEQLGLADTPSGSRLTWLRDIPKVPVEIVGTGPKMIAMAALVADCVLLAVGADPERLRWAVGLAKDARRAAGLDPDALSFGAYVNVVAHPDIAMARQLVSGGLATFARFSVMHGTPTGPQSAESEELLRNLHASYDMKHHTRTDSTHAATFPDEFVDRYATVGPAGAVVERLLEIGEVGIEKVIAVGPTAGGDTDEARRALRVLTADVLPALRR